MLKPIPPGFTGSDPSPVRIPKDTPMYPLPDDFPTSEDIKSMAKIGARIEARHLTQQYLESLGVPPGVAQREIDEPYCQEFIKEVANGLLEKST